jgi:tetratricopeptide (TPR) repeat protein
MFSKATNDGNRDQALQSTMNSWLAQGKYTEALEVNAKRIAAAGDAQTRIGLYNLAGFINVEANNLNAALAQFEMASKLQNDPSLAPGLKANREFNQRIARARYLAMCDDFAGAQAELDLATGRNVGQKRAFNQVSGILALRQKNYAKAGEFFAKANPADPYVWYYQAVSLEGAGDTKGAMTLYQRIADLNQLDATGYAIVRPRAMAKLKK